MSHKRREGSSVVALLLKTVANVNKPTSESEETRQICEVKT